MPVPRHDATDSGRAALGPWGPRGYAPGMFGFVNVNKPPGPTSFTVVATVRRQVNRKVKVGHAGTLDPFAGGVLVICVGPATRLTSYVQAAHKRYLAGVTLGATSTTDDTEGQLTATPGARAPDAEAVRQAVAQFVGRIEQVPPAFSAVHVDGSRAYKLARKGHALDIPPRAVTIHSIDVVRYAWPQLEIDVRCGGGTYIRSLARDIGAALGTGGYCASLTRTEVGPFTLDSAIDLGHTDLARHIITPRIALGDMATVTLNEAQIALIVIGRPVPCCDLPAPPPADADVIAMIDVKGELLALAKFCDEGRAVTPTKVFVAR